MAIKPSYGAADRAAPCTEWPLAACVPVMVSIKTMWLRLLCSFAAVAPTERLPACQAHAQHLAIAAATYRVGVWLHPAPST